MALLAVTVMSGGVSGQVVLVWGKRSYRCEPWAPAEIFPDGGGQNHRHFKKLTRFRRAVHKIDHFSASPRRKRKILCVFLRRFRLNYRVSTASAEGILQSRCRENFRVFCRTAPYDVTFFKLQGGHVPPLSPTAGAHGVN